MTTTRYVIPKGLVQKLTSLDHLLETQFDPSHVFGALDGPVTVAQLRAHIASIFATRVLTAEEELKRHARAQETMKLQGRLTKAQKKERTYRGDVKITVTHKK